MPTPEHQQHEQRTAHRWSVAQLLWLVVASGCSDGADPTTPVDPDDVDGDGIPNQVDRCPSAHDPSQHDEDGDRIGDRCDVCPTVFDPLQADTTELDALQFEDGVGDACDPRPQRGGDKIAAIHTFAVDDAAQWLGTGWAIDGDRARASTTAMWQHERTAPGGAVAVSATFSTVTWTAEGRLSILVDGDGVSSGLRCAVTQDRDGDGLDELEVEELGAGVAPTITSLHQAVLPELPLVLGATRAVDGARRGVFDCVVKYGTITHARIVTIDDLIVGQYAFGSDGAASEVTSVIVYTGPQPCPDPRARACPQ